MDPSNPDCAATRAALPEIALGIADGEERAQILEHVARCSDCRRELDQLSSLADDLITLAPEVEPPPGFESRVLRRLTVGRPPRHSARRRIRRLALAAVVPAVAAATALAFTISHRADLRLASQYRAALQGAHGTYFQSARLHAPGGYVEGVVFAYQGSPSWLFYALDARDGNHRYTEQIVTRSGRTFTLPPFTTVDATWGVATPVSVRDIARVRLIAQPNGSVLEAALPVVMP